MKLNDNKLESYDLKMEKMDKLNSKISTVLPELISRNTKLSERLKNKLKVSTLFNNIEQRNKKYLKGFIVSSNKRVNDLKTGLDMNKAIKQSKKTLTLLCNQMKDDLILKNSNVLLKEKKLLNENTEQETHLKINDSIHSIKNAIKPVEPLYINPPRKLMKSMSEEDIKKAKYLVSHKIVKEEKNLQEIINNYLLKMRRSFENKDYELNKVKIKKDFNRYIDNMSLDNNNKLINYKKPKPQPIVDKESANLIRIKKLLYPSFFDTDIINDNNKDATPNEKLNKLKKNSSMNDIHINSNNKTFKETQYIDDKINSFEVHGKDTMEVLNKLVVQGEYISERFKDKLKKVNSLIELNLPYPSNYEFILNNIKKKPHLNSDNNNNKKKNVLYSPQYSHRNTNKKNKSITPFIKEKISFIKEDLNHKKEEFLENNLSNIYFLPFLKDKTHNNTNKNNNDINNLNKSNEKNNMKNSFDNNKEEEKVFITSENNIN